jgi:hypothetical protein
VTVLLGRPPSLEFDDAECAALDVLANTGLVPPLRLVPASPQPSDPVAGPARRPGGPGRGGSRASEVG